MLFDFFRKKPKIIEKLDIQNRRGGGGEEMN